MMSPQGSKAFQTMFAQGRLTLGLFVPIEFYRRSIPTTHNTECDHLLPRYFRDGVLGIGRSGRTGPDDPSRQHVRTGAIARRNREPRRHCGVDRAESVCADLCVLHPSGFYTSADMAFDPQHSRPHIRRDSLPPGGLPSSWPHSCSWLPWCSLGEQLLVRSVLLAHAEETSHGEAAANR